MKYIILFSWSLLLFACQQEVGNSAASNEKVFFDLATFIQQEIETLQIEVTTLEKTATINGQKETKQIVTFDLAQELSPFINADINKTTWKDQYQVDSIWQAEQLSSIHYKALNENLKTQELQVSFEQGKVTAIEVQKGIDNMAVQAHQVLTYYPKKGYTINNEQSLVLATPQQVEVKVEFIR